MGLCERGGTEETSPGEQPLSLKERRHFKDKGFSSMSEESWMCRLSPEIQLRGLMEMEMESGASWWGGGSRDWRASKCGWCWRKHPLSQKNALNRLLSLHPQGNGVCVCVCVCVCVWERERYWMIGWIWNHLSDHRVQDIGLCGCVLLLSLVQLFATPWTVGL